MAIEPNLPLEQAKVRFPDNDYSATLPGMAENNPVQRYDCKAIFVYTALCSVLMLQNPHNLKGTRSGRLGSFPGGPHV